MSTRVNRTRGRVCALVLCPLLAFGQQTRYISGAVLDGNDQGVALTDIRAIGGPSTTTTCSGAFKLPLQPPLGVGSQLSFRCPAG